MPDAGGTNLAAPPLALQSPPPAAAPLAPAAWGAFEQEAAPAAPPLSCRSSPPAPPPPRPTPVPEAAAVGATDGPAAAAAAGVGVAVTAVVEESGASLLAAASCTSTVSTARSHASQRGCVCVGGMGGRETGCTLKRERVRWARRKLRKREARSMSCEGKGG
jgi:hypothetical protein